MCCTYYSIPDEDKSKNTKILNIGFLSSRVINGVIKTTLSLTKITFSQYLQLFTFTYVSQDCTEGVNLITICFAYHMNATVQISTDGRQVWLSIALLGLPFGLAFKKTLL